jgi:acetyl esterase/lipase
MYRLDIILALEQDLPTQEQFMSQLRLLHNFCNELQTFYHEYDYDKETPGNGFRSMVKICDIYFKKLLDQHKLSNLTAHPDILKEYQTIANTLIKGMAIAIMIRQKGVNYDLLNITEEDTNIFKKLFAVSAEDIEPLFSHLSAFFYKDGIQPIVKTILFIWHYFNSTARQRLGLLAGTACSLRQRATFANNLTVSGIKTMDEIVPRNSLTRYLTDMLTRGVINRTSVECFNKYEILARDESSPAVIQEIHDRCSVVETYFLLPREAVHEKQIKSIILHCPGGGFVMGHPESFIMILSKYVETFGVPVVTLNYGKAPKHPFPSQVQELLDLYLFLTSGDDRVIELIGFHPDRIVISGDSAGACIAMGTIFAMHKIRKQYRDSRIQMPHALLTWYPYFLPSFVAFPSYCILPVCPMSQAAAIATINPAYLGIEVDDEHWYKKANPAEFMNKCGSRMKDPLFNNFAFDDFESLKQIEFYSTAAEMDPLLDHAVLMAKKWRGRVVLDILPDISHAFNMFPHHPALQKECERVMHHYSLALGISL